MAIGQKLQIRQGQSLVMTPQLQQAIKLLQLNNLELAEFVEAELESNPLLQRDDSEERSETAEGSSSEESELRSDAEGSLEELRIREDGDTAAADAAMDADYESLNPDAATSEVAAEAPAYAGAGGATDWSRTGSGGAPDDGAGPEATAGGKTLHEHLFEQLAVAARNPAQRLIGAALIDLIDDDGYLRTDLNEVANRLGADKASIEKAVALIQTFEPTGVGARSLKECLALQLKDRDRYDPAMAALVENLELLAKHDYKKLKALCGVDDVDLADMVAELKALTPKPGLSFSRDSAAAIEPDVYVREKSGGGWSVEINSDTLPRVLVDARYYAEVSAAAKSDQERTFISECHQNANWLVKSLDQRQRTILKVSSEIVRMQDGFFAKGVKHLRPLNLKTVAEAVGMHESTVSRVTSNKYVSTPRGLFELKYFFTASIASSSGGEAHSAEAVRHKIKSLIDAETASDVLSDDRIVELLRDEGIDIARRTVAKYREALRIPSSVQRRRMLLRAS
jgi:RNA polymerase sigma-54 factor